MPTQIYLNDGGMRTAKESAAEIAEMVNTAIQSNERFVVFTATDDKSFALSTDQVHTLAEMD